MTMRLRRMTALLALTAASAACGTTVPLAQQRALQPGGGLGADATGSTVPGASGAGNAGGTLSTSGAGGSSTGVTGPSSSGAQSTSSASTGTGSTSATPGASAQAPSGAAVPPTGKGWDRTYVYLGVVTENDTQKAFGAFGGSVDPGDTTAQANAVADEINARGGILGRTVKLRFQDVKTVATATDPTSVGNQVCTHFSQDSPVIAVMSIVTVMDYPNFRSCLARAHIPLFSATVKTVDDVAARALAPYYYQTIGASWNVVAPVLVRRLQAQGYFSGWNARLGQPTSGTAKVGILVDGTDVGTRVGKVLSAEVKRAGYQALVYQYTQASDGQSKSVQYFEGNNVTHVIVTDVELTAFQNSAAGQSYKPRYGISTYNDPYNNLENGGLTPAGANNGAIGIGWAPPMDVSGANDPGATPGGPACLKVMAAHGQNFSGKRLAQAYAYSFCDAMHLIALGATTGHGFSGPAIASGIVAGRASFRPAISFGAGVTQDQHAVAGIARDLSYVSSCSCFRYGPTRTSL